MGKYCLSRTTWALDEWCLPIDSPTYRGGAMDAPFFFYNQLLQCNLEHYFQDYGGSVWVENKKMSTFHLWRTCVVGG